MSDSFQPADDTMPDARSRAEESGARALATALRSVAVAETDRRGLMVRPGRLPPGLVRPQHRQRLRSALEPLLSANRARLFRLPDQAMVVLWRGEARPHLRHTLEALGRAVADLPGQIADMTGLVTLVELPRDTETVLAVIDEALKAAKPRQEAFAVRSETAPLDLGALATLEQALAQADVAHFARRKPVCAPTGAGTGAAAMRLVWERRFLSVAELAATLVPEHSPQAEPWLFRRLTRTLDRRMLALLSHRDELELAGPFSLSLNVASILSQHFARFDAALPNRLRGEIVLELLPADILADLRSFMLARDQAQGRGYRLLLRRVTPELLPVLPIGELGIDLLQLRWSGQWLRDGAGVVAEAGFSPGSAVLGGADHQDAVEWGLAQGITLFQGAAARPPPITRLPIASWRQAAAI